MTPDFSTMLEKLLAPATFGSAKVAFEVANQFEDGLLHHEMAPKNFFDFAFTVLGDKRLMARRGIFHLIGRLYNDRHKFSASNLRQLFEAIESTYAEVIEEETALNAVDFFVRCSPVEFSTAMLKRLTNISMTATQLHGVLVGIDILVRARLTDDLNLVKRLSDDANRKLGSLKPRST